MPEETSIHTDVAGYALGSLTPGERDAFEGHLVTCRSCQAELRQLRQAGDLLRSASPSVEPPTGLAARTMAAIDQAAAGKGSGTPSVAPEEHTAPTPSRPRRRRFPVTVRRGGFALAAALVLGGAVYAGTVLDDGDDEGAPVELQASLQAPDGRAVQAGAEVVKTGIGRVIQFDTRDLPILPKKDYYELWFVGPGDTLKRPNRISAGTFHPDPQGRSSVRFAAAVDPAKYPVLSVTSEPGDGNPQRTGREVLRSTSP